MRKEVLMLRDSRFMARYMQMRLRPARAADYPPTRFAGHTTIAAAMKDLVLYKRLLHSSQLSLQVNRVCAFSRVREKWAQ